MKNCEKDPVDLPREAVRETYYIRPSKGRGLPSGLLLCAHACVSGGRLQRALAAEDGSGDESNDKADGKGFDEGIGHVHERVLVELL
jgi:hypothetical protein